MKQPFTLGSPTKGEYADIQEEEGTHVIKNLCMLCLERKSDAVIMDCGHSKICFFCAFKMYRTQNLCHLCRQDISKVIKVKRSHGLSYQKVIGIL
jgi:Zinc finger, C3HC4 type (RING finger)